VLVGRGHLLDGVTTEQEFERPRRASSGVSFFPKDLSVRAHEVLPDADCVGGTTCVPAAQEMALRNSF